MNVNKQKVKEFVIEHKKELAVTGLMVLSGMVGYKMGYKGALKHEVVVTNSVVKRCLRDASDVYNNRIAAFGGWTMDGIKPEELGELGKKMLDLEVDNNVNFTHFIAIGKNVEP